VLVRKGFFGSIAILLTGAGLGLAQEPAPTALPPAGPDLVAAQPAGEKPAGEPIAGPVAMTWPEVSWDNASDEPYSVWGGIEFLNWYLKSSPEPSVRLSGPGPAFVPRFGGLPLQTANHVGARFTIGADLNEDVGVEANYFFLGSRTASVSVLAPPGSVFRYIDAQTGRLSAITTAAPGLDTDRETIRISQSMQGYELTGLLNVSRDADTRVDLLGGFRYLDLREDLQYRTDLAGVAGGPVPNLMYAISDTFNTRNQFYGGNLGARVSASRGSWFFSATGKFALGNVHERLFIQGNSVALNGGAFFNTGTFPGQGISAQPTNNGVYTRDQFAVVPELTAKIGYNVSSNIRVIAGYNLIYISEVARPGNQVSALINTSSSATFGNAGGRFVGPPLPLPTGRGSDFFAQGLNLGMEFSW
jgi:Putative beta barrel porin-7 (BBP7)